MSPQEAVAIARLVKACCPQQAWDEYTGDAYHDLLGDLRFEDCRAAVVDLGKRQVFIAPAEVRAEVKRIRTARLTQHEILDPPPGLDPDATSAYSRWLDVTRQAIADGEVPPTPPELPTRTMPDMHALMPKVDAVTAQERAAEDAIEHRRKREAARAELANRPPIPVPPTAAVAVRQPETEEVA